MNLLFNLFIFTSFLSSPALAEQYDFSIKMLTSNNCVYCKVFDSTMANQGSKDSFKIKVKGSQYTVSIQRIVVEEHSIEELQLMGYESFGTPAFDYYINENPVGSIRGLPNLTGKFDPTRVASDFTKISSQLINSYMPAFDKSTFKGTQFLANQQSSVILIGTGSNWKENPASVGAQIKSIKTHMQHNFGFSEENIFTLHGDGASKNCLFCPAIFASDSVKISRRGTMQRHRVKNVNPTGSFEIGTLSRAFKQTSNEGLNRRLVVMLGHGSPEGAATWKPSSSDLTKKNFQNINALFSGETVMLNGNCFGGLFADEVKCGFFSARPDTLSTGCYPDENKKASIYLDKLFGSQIMSEADLNKDSKISFNEAHSYATFHTDERDVTYSSRDALIENNFDKVFPNLNHMQIKDIKAKAKPYLNTFEQKKFDSLINQMNADRSVAITKTVTEFTINNIEFAVLAEPGNTYYLDINQNSINDLVSGLPGPADSYSSIFLWSPAFGKINNFVDFMKKIEKSSTLDKANEAIESGKVLPWQVFIASNQGSITEVASVENQPVLNKAGLQMIREMNTGERQSKNLKDLHLAQLARLGLWKKAVAEGQLASNGDLSVRDTEILACQSQSLGDFLGTPAQLKPNVPSSFFEKLFGSK